MRYHLQLFITRLKEVNRNNITDGVNVKPQKVRAFCHQVLFIHVLSSIRRLTLVHSRLNFL